MSNLRTLLNVAGATVTVKDTASLTKGDSTQAINAGDRVFYNDQPGKEGFYSVKDIATDNWVRLTDGHDQPEGYERTNYEGGGVNTEYWATYIETNNGRYFRVSYSAFGQNYATNTLGRRVVIDEFDTSTFTWTGRGSVNGLTTNGSEFDALAGSSRSGPSVWEVLDDFLVVCIPFFDGLSNAESGIFCIDCNGTGACTLNYVGLLNHSYNSVWGCRTMAFRLDSSTVCIVNAIAGYNSRMDFQRYDVTGALGSRDMAYNSTLQSNNVGGMGTDITWFRTHKNNEGFGNILSDGNIIFKKATSWGLPTDTTANAMSILNYSAGVLTEASTFSVSYNAAANFIKISTDTFVAIGLNGSSFDTTFTFTPYTYTAGTDTMAAGTTVEVSQVLPIGYKLIQYIIESYIEFVYITWENQEWRILSRYGLFIVPTDASAVPTVTESKLHLKPYGFNTPQDTAFGANPCISILAGNYAIGDYSKRSRTNDGGSELKIVDYCEDTSYWGARNVGGVAVADALAGATEVEVLLFSGTAIYSTCGDTPLTLTYKSLVTDNTSLLMDPGTNFWEGLHDTVSGSPATVQSTYTAVNGTLAGSARAYNNTSETPQIDITYSGLVGHSFYGTNASINGNVTAVVFVDNRLVYFPDRANVGQSDTTQSFTTQHIVEHETQLMCYGADADSETYLDDFDETF